MESPVTQVDASHWFVHILECMSSTALLLLLIGVTSAGFCAAEAFFAGSTKVGEEILAPQGLEKQLD